MLVAPPGVWVIIRVCVCVLLTVLQGEGGDMLVAPPGVWVMRRVCV